jgi:molybdopterin-guanine dinucleotide biosynthesis protein A
MSYRKAAKNHQKHTQSIKPEQGVFGRNELAITGTSCSSIKALAIRLSKQLSAQYRLAFVDAEHPEKNSARASDGADSSSGIDLSYIRKESVRQFNINKPTYNYRLKRLFTEQDLVILNGNHFEAPGKITVIDPHKPVDPAKFSGTKIIVLQKGVSRIPDDVKKHIKEMAEIPVFNIDEIPAIASCIEQFLVASTPPLTGLVLAGGKSTRMHTDKTRLNYHGKPQHLYLYELIEHYCDRVFLSCREEQENEIPENYDTITDTFLEMGPFGALLSAFRQQPNSAWLTVACDLPLLSSQTLQTLVDSRNPSKIATAFRNPKSDFPEPLITIWEPKSYQVLLQFLGMGCSCPRKVLINADIEILEAPDAQELMNANTPQEYERALAHLTCISHKQKNGEE